MAIFSSTNTVKLNVLTEAGATVTINSNPTTPGQGPFPLTGNTLWETYAITGIAGNVTIASTKAVTAGINGGYNTLSYGGYFAGFSSMPVISKKSGDCAPGIVLEVDDHFESYQWYLNNNPIAGAHSNTYAPIQGGDYTVVVTMGSCSATTLKYVVESCYIQTVKNLTVCENQVTITPQFSNPTYPAVSLGTITIDVSPTHGTATINPATGVVTYTPNSGFIGDDALVFHFCSDVPTLNCEQVTVHLSVDPTPVVNKAVLKSCALITNPNTALFNLEDAVITSHPGVVKKYYATMTDLNNQTNEISPTNYISPSNTIYVKVINSKGCYSVTEISLVVIQTPSSALLQDKIICIGDKTILDAGPGYDGYEWSTGETTQSILVSAGEYSVKLSKERCYIIQNVKVLVAVQPVISSIEIKNNTITVNVIGGRAPYLYSSDGVNWQESNIFTNVPRGENKIFVKDYYNCEPTHITVTVPNLINAITPNGDLKNDYLDYSELAYKQNLIFNIYDRYGNKIHEAKKFNGYKWDGTMFGKKVSTATYWYEISWTEPNKAQTITRYTGWVLVKNFE
ncbi:T9SS type B sorting domain-containing protein [Chryseobacterium arachidis]